jgi:hypothetical protein
VPYLLQIFRRPDENTYAGFAQIVSSRVPAFLAASLLNNGIFSIRKQFPNVASALYKNCYAPIEWSAGDGRCSLEVIL